VVEIGCPALHETFADHEMSLPNGRSDPTREFSGQRFLRHVAERAPWTEFRGATAQETGLVEATCGLAQARTIKPGGTSGMAVPPHDGELIFGLVVEGSASLDFGERFDLGAGDAFVIPPGEAWGLSAMSDDFRLLHATTGKMDLAAGD